MTKRMQSQQMVQLAAAGTPQAVDTLMHHLEAQPTFTVSRQVDYALGQVQHAAGQQRLAHFLFHGTPRQRNFAALYFKRRGQQSLLDEAVARGCIDGIQAYLK